MHGSIPTVTIPWSHPRGFAIFSSLGGLFPTPRHKERGNQFPTPGTLKKQTEPFHKKTEIFITFYNGSYKSQETSLQLFLVLVHDSLAFKAPLLRGFSNTGFINLEKLFSKLHN